MIPANWAIKNVRETGRTFVRNSFEDMIILKNEKNILQLFIKTENPCPLFVDTVSWLGSAYEYVRDLNNLDLEEI